MALEIRLAKVSDYPRLEQLVIESFEPITWFKRVDERFGPLNGSDWRGRWQLRFRKAFNTQIVLVGEIEGEVVAYASGTYTPETRLAFVDLLAVDRRFQGRDFGREMLSTMMGYMKEQGAEHLHLDCLTDNEAGNALYRSEGFEEMARSIHWFIKIP